MPLSSIQKRAIFKIAVDLVKADYQIHGNEVDFLEQLQRKYAVPADDLDLIHYMTLQEATSVVSGMDAPEKADVCSMFRQIVSADNDIDFRESILLSAILLQLESGSSGCVKIITTLDSNAEYVNDQLVYLEEKECTQARGILKDPYENLLMTSILSKMGLQLFYLPDVVNSLDASSAEGHSAEILQKSIEYMVPLSFGMERPELRESLKMLDIPMFTQLICSNYRIDAASLGMSAYVMLNINEGYVLDDEANKHRCLDMLCIDVSDNLKERILDLVRLLSKPQYAISYKGYYKVLYDFLSLENKVNSGLLVDESLNFVFDDWRKTPLNFKSAPQCKTLYLLLLFYSPTGISQTIWAAAESLLGRMDSWNLQDEMDVRLRLMQCHSEAADLIANIMLLYNTFAHHDCSVSKMLQYVRSIIVHRSSLKNYINNAIDAATAVSDKEQYRVVYLPESKSYAVRLRPDCVKIQTSETTTPYRASYLWNVLRK